MKFKVYGSVKVGVTVTVDADDEHSALEAAYEQFGGLTAYAGNGGMDKIVGVSEENVSLEVFDDFGEFTDVEKE